jgi:aspartyl-tRNA(Asn)/glutamyl-tRNA(Gln) amidotransferase subunit A
MLVVLFLGYVRKEELMSDDELCLRSAVRVARAIRSREVSPVEVTRASLERIERLNPIHNAYLTVCAEEALANARDAEAAVMREGPLGLLHGVPTSIKDILFLKGVRATGGSLAYKDFVPDHDAPAAARIRDGGAIILGKTNTPEFGVIPTTENRLGEPCRNPWDPERTTGGSSGGAGAAAALGMGFLHLGTDGGGSIRIPSSFCGVFGIKPTHGRVPPYTKGWGGFGGWPTLAQAGPMTRYVEDAAMLLDVIAGPEPGDPFAVPAHEGSFAPRERDRLGLRIAWTPDLGFASVDPEVRSLSEAAALKFRDLGCEVDEVAPDVDDAMLAGAFLPIAAAWDMTTNVELYDERPDILTEYSRNFFALGKQVTGEQYVKAEQTRAKLWRVMDDFLSEYDLLLTPVLATPPFPIDQHPTIIDGKKVRPMGWTPFTAMCNLTGQPAASLPCGSTSEGLPVGLHVIARAFREQTIFDAAFAFQRAQPWQERRPAEMDGV